MCGAGRLVELEAVVGFEGEADATGKADDKER